MSDLPRPETAGQGLTDPWDGDPRLAEYFTESWTSVAAYHAMLVQEGEMRGLLGPREVSRLWERHLLNSAAVVPFLPETGLIVDIGSGAGLPGVVIAAMRPGAEVVLVEPMERRTVWLTEVVERLGLTNVEVRRARAQELWGVLEADAVTARAVAALDKLYRWTAPLVRPGGVIVALKGERATDELTTAAPAMRELGLKDGRVVMADTIAGVEATRVVIAERGRGPRVR